MTYRTETLPVPAEGAGPGELLGAAVEVERAYHRQLFGHADLVDSPESVAQGLRRQERTRRERAVAIDGDGTVVGSVSLGAPLLDNTSLGFFFASPDPKAPTEAVMDALWAHAQAFYDVDGRTTVHSWAQHPSPEGSDGEEVVVPRTGAGALVRDDRADWFQANGFVLEQCERYSVLDLGPEVLERAREVLAAGAPAPYTLRTWTGATPEDLLDGMAALHRRMSVDAPSGEMEFEEEHWDADEVRAYDERLAATGRLAVTAAALDEAGRPVAYTIVTQPEDLPQVAYQDDTLVHGEHRGHGLGLLVKAANVELLARERPAVRRIHTWNAVENSHMLAINEALGFRAAGVEGGWQHRR